MSEGSGQSQRYCTNCGAEIRSGNAFCVSCGVSVEALAPGAGRPEAAYQGSGSTEGFTSMPDTRQESVRGGRNQFEQAFDFSVEYPRRILERIVAWFRDLPLGVKAAIAGVGLLLVLILLSPVAFFVAAIALVVSIIALILRARNRAPLKRWGITAGFSVGLLLLSGGVSDALYGTSFFGGGGSSGSGRDGEYAGGINPQEPASVDQYSDAGSTAYTAEPEPIDPDNVRVPIMSVQQSQERPTLSVTDEGKILHVIGYRSPLHEEDIRQIAEYFQMRPEFSDYDGIIVDVANVSSEYTFSVEDMADMVGSCSSSTIRIANGPAAALELKVRIGHYAASCQS